MKFLTLPSFRTDCSLVQLSDFLSVIPENTWIWSVMDFYGVGVAPNNLSMEDFETVARSEPIGFIMTWPELKDFASSLEQTYDCLIVAAKSKAMLLADKSVKESFGACEVVIEAFDSTEWSFWAREKAIIDQLIATQIQ